MNFFARFTANLGTLSSLILASMSNTGLFPFVYEKVNLPFGEISYKKKFLGAKTVLFELIA
ncbi:MAG: hypothetical protein SWO11_11260 [Thermodesulfobacteriota bacterium]|nr:hypothetical protein [Thermodesulfobacteriota bacterium]